MESSETKNETICGIDPGFARLGYAFIRLGKKPEVIEAACLETRPGREQAERIREIIERLKEKISLHGPKSLAMEKLFFAKNQKTALKVAEMRGALLFLASSLNVPLREYSPSEIKLAVAGSGNADKKAVKKMVKIILKLDKIPEPDDITDALAVALCGIYSR